MTDLRAIEHQLARPFQDPLAALSGGIGSQGLASQLVQGAPDDPLHLTHPQLHCPRQARVHCLYPVNLLTYRMTPHACLVLLSPRDMAPQGMGSVASLVAALLSTASMA